MTNILIIFIFFMLLIVVGLKFDKSKISQVKGMSAILKKEQESTYLESVAATEHAAALV